MILTRQPFKEAMTPPEAEKRKAAVDKEMASFKDLGIYILVPASSIPPARKIIRTKWVFKRKAGATFKARLVVQGWGLVPGVDCGGTFVPVCRLQSVHMVLDTAAEMRCEVFQLDVKMAFLNADVEEDVHVKMAPGYENTNKIGEPQVIRLHKNLYGLPNSPLNWWKTIGPFMLEIGFEPLMSDTCVYVYHKNGTTIIITLCVDDLLLLGEEIVVLEMLKKELMGQFKMTDMGNVSLVLGVEVPHDREQGTLSISLQNYNKSIFERVGMGKCNPLITPGGGARL